MKPLKLVLKGFTGVAGHPDGQIELDLRKIPDAAALVAIVGPNGSGKTSILDNLHPYRVMPSRATTMTPGGFSYWDNISEKEASKNLLWEHDGLQYNTILTFRQTGKTRKTECFLLKKEGDGWVPAEADGIISDGKSDTYDAVVEAILGKPERFFTAQFSAQNRKLISDYGASEIKSLLASILSLDASKACAEKANEVARLLQAHVNALKEQAQKAYVAMKDKAAAEASLKTLKAESKTAREKVEAAAKATGSAVAEVSRIQVLVEQEADKEEQRQAISKRIAEVQANAADTEAKAMADCKAATEQLAGDIAALHKEVADAARHDGLAKAQIAKDREILSQEEAIRQAAFALPQVQKGIATLEARIAEGKKELERFSPVKKAILEVSKELADITAKGKAVKQRIVMLKDTSAQLENVPCKGNVQCPLIANAINAKGQLAPVEGERLDLCSQYRQLKEKLASLEQDEKVADALEKAIAGHEEHLKKGLKKEAELKVAYAQQAVFSDAKERIAKMEEALAENARKSQSLSERIAAAKKRQAELDQDYAKTIEAVRNKADVEIKALAGQLDKLGKGIAKGVLALAMAKAESCRKDEEAARQAVEALTKKQVSLMATIEACAKIQDDAKSVLDDIARIEAEVAGFRLVEKGFGVNGIIALSIDDAGPAVAAICNQLLHDCFDGRFSVRLNTQKATQKGDIRETFDVVVFDNVKGGEKVLGMMSGGERVWVNECLTRAIALYVAQTSDTRFETLFTDEADGALDPERKRQFIAMKRAIMKTGGYSREYFVSQTPELWDMADYVIHVDQL